MLNAYVAKLKSHGYRGRNMKTIVWVGSVLAMLAGFAGLIAFVPDVGGPVVGFVILGSDFALILLLALVHGVMQIRDLLKETLVTRAPGK
jgi:uncharacterized BrkB/YihY/UPF0761 family membrane protein